MGNKLFFSFFQVKDLTPITHCSACTILHAENTLSQNSLSCWDWALFKDLKSDIITKTDLVPEIFKHKLVSLNVFKRSNIICDAHHQLVGFVTNLWACYLGNWFSCFPKHFPDYWHQPSHLRKQLGTQGKFNDFSDREISISIQPGLSAKISLIQKCSSAQCEQNRIRIVISAWSWGQS